MPLILQHIGSHYRWAIWRINETPDELLVSLPQAESYQEAAGRFSSESRRREWLAVRALLYTMLGERKDIAYSLEGKPYLKDGSALISISHTRDYAAVILGEKPLKEVGIDIERYGERVRKVASRFMRNDETACVYHGTDLWAQLLHWSCKETMYKCLNEQEVDFREHLRLFPFTLAEDGEIEAVEYKTSVQRRFCIRYRLHPDFVLTWTAF